MFFFINIIAIIKNLKIRAEIKFDGSTVLILMVFCGIWFQFSSDRNLISSLMKRKTLNVINLPFKQKKKN